jgi:hypothetical protein
LKFQKQNKTIKKEKVLKEKWRIFLDENKKRKKCLFKKKNLFRNKVLFYKK